MYEHLRGKGSVTAFLCHETHIKKQDVELWNQTDMKMTPYLFSLIM